MSDIKKYCGDVSYNDQNKMKETILKMIEKRTLTKESYPKRYCNDTLHMYTFVSQGHVINGSHTGFNLITILNPDFDDYIEVIYSNVDQKTLNDYLQKYYENKETTKGILSFI